MPASFWIFCLTLGVLVVASVSSGTTLITILAVLCFGACCTVLKMLSMRMDNTPGVSFGDLATFAVLAMGAAFSLRFILA